MPKKASWFICFLLLAISCLDEPDCFRLNNNIIGIAFKKMIGGAADTVALVGVQASGTDSIFNDYILTSGIYLPLNFFESQTAFSIQGLEELNQLVVGYDVRTQFVSDECGARYVLSNLSVLNQSFDSIRIVSNSPYTSESGANIEIFRCPRTNVAKISFRQLQLENSVVSARKIFSVGDDYSGTTRYIDTTLQSINLPLNPDANTSTFDLNMADQSAPSTLTMTYTRKPRKFYDLCGDQQLFAGLKITGATNFDSILLVKDSIQDPPVTNIIVYKCAQTNLIRLSFRQPGTQVRADTIYVKQITDDYSGNIYYANANPALGYTTVTLPLDTAKSSTIFTFDIHGQSTQKILKVFYTRTPTILFNACGSQYLFSDLRIEASTDPLLNFTISTVRVTTVSYPTVTNIEIIQ